MDTMYFYFSLPLTRFTYLIPFTFLFNDNAAVHSSYPLSSSCLLFYVEGDLFSLELGRELRVGLPACVIFPYLKFHGNSSLEYTYGVGCQCCMN